jgi:hypothetical protein
MSRSFYTVRPRIGKKRPVGTYSAAIFIRLGNVIGADRNQSAIGNFELTMQLNQQFGLATVFGARASGAEDKPLGMLSLQLGELPAFGAVIGKLVAGEDSS